MKLLTIGIPYHNERENLWDTLSSINSQRMASWDAVEIIIGTSSTDFDPIDTSEFKHISNNIRYCHEPKEWSSAGNSRNLIIDNAAGEWIFWIDTGDVFYSVYSLYNLFVAIQQMTQKDVLIQFSKFEEPTEDKFQRVVADKYDWVFLQGKLFNLSEIKAHNIHLCPYTHCYEDDSLSTLYRFIVSHNQTIVFDIPIACWTFDASSVSRGNNSSTVFNTYDEIVYLDFILSELTRRFSLNVINSENVNLYEQVQVRIESVYRRHTVQSLPYAKEYIGYILKKYNFQFDYANYSRILVDDTVSFGVQDIDFFIKTCISKYETNKDLIDKLVSENFFITIKHN